MESNNSRTLKPFSMILEFNGGKEALEFPVLPEKITIKRSGGGNDFNIIGKGRVATIEKPNLAEIDIQSFFPSQMHPFVTSKQLDEPWVYVHKINRWIHSGYPIRFIYTGIDPTNLKSKLWLPMTIDSFERWEEAGSPGDVNFSLKLREYVFYAPIKITYKTKNDGTTEQEIDPPQRPDLRVPPTTYTIIKGDTLIKISMKLYNGDSSRWKEIQKLNQLSDSDLKKLQIGQVLKVPLPKT
ncbi:hypothetical protein PA598K_04196 [Paenibacillus sp. 598K]|uniref:LysM peptidoglycan-binding domain-containing protein n=1 Tax=Paenibacillus sp. 598K TaxID=1117987 RepID=UPI000FF9BAC0|nr:LysM peptidoglycan-binding domain-containing protein [Paenibacillus sp. 598K]GBF75765.1 hypothetical protein PA598K_04196 [Paenibacillus sp. 598K]